MVVSGSPEGVAADVEVHSRLANIAVEGGIVVGGLAKGDSGLAPLIGVDATVLADCANVLRGVEIVPGGPARVYCVPAGIIGVPATKDGARSDIVGGRAKKDRASSSVAGGG